MSSISLSFSCGRSCVRFFSLTDCLCSIGSGDFGSLNEGSSSDVNCIGWTVEPDIVLLETDTGVILVLDALSLLNFAEINLFSSFALVLARLLT